MKNKKVPKEVKDYVIARVKALLNDKKAMRKLARETFKIMKGEYHGKKDKQKNTKKSK